MPKIQRRRSQELNTRHTQTTSLMGRVRKVSFEESQDSLAFNPLNSCSSGSLQGKNCSRNLKPKLSLRRATPTVSLTELNCDDNRDDPNSIVPIILEESEITGGSPWGFFIDVASPSSDEEECLSMGSQLSPKSSTALLYQPYYKPRHPNRKGKGFLPSYFLSIPSANDVEVAMKRMHV
eukprot:CAMPEP_0178918722 /NCGR_PEP_ID=MMETSP0786-20121207/13983_1 /TAXON_ID=186022 /ORGANISM="Thalassionema frauenfeldii, Strain CCMP 1798" /LENGTH=178 /DNA_ID=CAMNT_0020592461 /DNA_START=224 /DNA_END=760 /DNA_ORIENTATION=-